MRNIECLQSFEQSYVEAGVQILELARHAQELFERQRPREKRRLLNFILSNCSWGDGEAIATFRQPFDVLLKTNAVAARRKAANTADPSKNEIWPCGIEQGLQLHATSFASGTPSAVSGRKTFSPRSSAQE